MFLVARAKILLQEIKIAFSLYQEHIYLASEINYVGVSVSYEPIGTEFCLTYPN